MATLLEKALTQFNARKATEETMINDEFKRIAKTVLYGGYFLVNGTVRIYPLEIEFYLHGELESDRKKSWMTDIKMIHRNYKDKEKTPYFPKKGSLYPHTFGVDVTFENEEENYRASFLIREYLYVDEKERVKVSSPSFLWEDMFGYNSFSENGLQIKWVDDEEQVKEPSIDTRKNLNNADGTPDTKPWRFTKV